MVITFEINIDLSKNQRSNMKGTFQHLRDPRSSEGFHGSKHIHINMYVSCIYDQERQNPSFSLGFLAFRSR